MSAPATTIATPWGDLMKEQLVDFIKMVKSGAGAAMDLANDQAPLILREIINFHLWKYGLTAILLLSAFIFLLYWIVRGWKWAVNEDDEAAFVIMIIGSFLNAILGFITWGGIMKYMKVYFAPRLFIIEYISELLK